MEKYIGTKVLKAVPMTRRDYNDYRGWVMPENEIADEPGFLVEYEDDDHANHIDHVGYISWSPATVFNKAYHITDGMSFGLAIDAMRLGHRVRRAGWNGNGIFIGITHPGQHAYMTQPYIFIDTTELATDNPDANKGRVPWLASQTDMLSDDWELES